MPDNQDGSAGEISVGSVYTLPEFKRRTGLDDKAVRKAQRNGLRTVQVGRCKFVLGSDFCRFLASQVGDELADMGPLSAGDQPGEGGVGGVARSLEVFASKEVEPKTNTNERLIGKTEGTDAATEAPPNIKTPGPYPAQRGPVPSQQRTAAKKKRPRSGSDVVVIPAVLDTPAFVRQWEVWIAYRKRRRLTCIEMTLQSQLDDELAPHGAEQAITMLKRSITKGWQGIFPIEPGADARSPQQSTRKGIAPEAMAQFREER